MDWILFLQIMLLIPWFAMFMQLGVNGVTKGYWEERTKMARGIGSVNECKSVMPDKPKPHTTYEAA